MIRSESNRFGKTLYILYPGDYFATSANCLLATVTGSCVVVCIHDAARNIGGMGHFILPGAMGTEGIIADDIAKQGIASMEHLMGEMVKQGSSRKSLRAILYGAGVFGSGASAGATSGGNIRFLHEYFSLEKIHVSREDLGGTVRRKIFFCPRTGVSYRKFLKNNNDHSEFMKLENEYISYMFVNKEKCGRIILFD
ncbi:MAG: chemotaxis protein CheD [Spirochaetes bacterium]|nr:chemotaxis protein CheD [Spirochaetota bacterium]